MDSVCATFYEDVVFHIHNLEAVLELSGRWGTVAERHEKKRTVYYFTLTQDSNTNAWKYRFHTTCLESFSLSELRERKNWRFCQISLFLCETSTTDSMGKEVSESDLFSILLPFVSSRLCRKSRFWLNHKTLSQEDASRIFRQFEGKGQLRTIDLPYYSEVSERFLKSHVDVGGKGNLQFLNNWPENTKPFLLNYLATANSTCTSLPSSLKFGTKVLDVVFKRWSSQDDEKYFSIKFSSDLLEEQIRKHCLFLAGIKENEGKNFELMKLKYSNGLYSLWLNRFP
uniref:FBA_2 domain-containing protein n=1 Tax=Steinernema glaseri TaxID=37863 RepID=A0A1I7YKV8_9BILA